MSSPRALREMASAIGIHGTNGGDDSDSDPILYCNCEPTVAIRDCNCGLYQEEMAMAAVLASWRLLASAPDAVKADPAVVLAAVKRSGGDALQSASKGLQECPYLRGWAALSHKGRRNRCVREAFLHKHSERNARVQAGVDLWLINQGLADHISAKNGRSVADQPRPRRPHQRIISATVQNS